MPQTFARLCIPGGQPGDVEKEQGRDEKGQMHCVLNYSDAACEAWSQRYVDANPVHMHGVQLCSATPQIRHSEAARARGDVYVVLGQVRELHPCPCELSEGNEVQPLHSDEACAPFQSSTAAIQRCCHMAL